MPPSKEQKWEERFDEEFEFTDLTFGSARERVKSFINQTLREQLTEILEELSPESNSSDAWENGYSSALAEFRSIITTRLSSLDSNQKEI